MLGKTQITDHLEAALKGAALRQSAIANNIANLNTPNYRRLDVPFEKLLASAIENDKPVDRDELIGSLTQPKNTEVGPNGNDVNLEKEVGDMIRNVSMQKAYLRLLSKRYKKMQMAMEVR